MKNSTKPSLTKNIEDILLETSPKIIGLQDLKNVEFEYGLRRALLNSSFFSGNSLKKWQKRLGINRKFVIILSAASLLAFSVIFVVDLKTEKSAISEKNPYFFVNSPDQSQKVSTEEFFNNLYLEGKIKYNHQENNGSRVYLIEINKDSFVELKDPNPYTIRLTSSP